VCFFSHNIWIIPQPQTEQSSEHPGLFSGCQKFLCDSLCISLPLPEILWFYQGRDLTPLAPFLSFPYNVPFTFPLHLAGAPHNLGLYSREEPAGPLDGQPSAAPGSQG
jgi:hypothetical protein